LNLLCQLVSKVLAVDQNLVRQAKPIWENEECAFSSSNQTEQLNGAAAAGSNSLVNATN